jgi:di- and tripeptidase
MLASAAGRFKDRHIYATGGNDNSVGIWDLTEFFMTQEELPPISNGTSHTGYSFGHLLNYI